MALLINYLSMRKVFSLMSGILIPTILIAQNGSTSGNLSMGKMIPETGLPVEERVERLLDQMTPGGEGGPALRPLCVG